MLEKANVLHDSVYWVCPLTFQTVTINTGERTASSSASVRTELSATLWRDHVAVLQGSMDATVKSRVQQAHLGSAVCRGASVQPEDPAIKQQESAFVGMDSQGLSKSKQTKQLSKFLKSNTDFVKSDKNLQTLAMFLYEELTFQFHSKSDSWVRFAWGHLTDTAAVQARWWQNDKSKVPTLTIFTSFPSSVNANIFLAVCTLYMYILHTLTIISQILAPWWCWIKTQRVGSYFTFLLGE